VIGNPPYGAELNKSTKTYLSEKYPFVADFETSQYFFGLAKIITKLHGSVSFIVPNTLFLNIYATKFRTFIATSFSIRKFVNLSHIDVFQGSIVRTVIPFLKKGYEKESVIEFIVLYDATKQKIMRCVEQHKFTTKDNEWIKAFSTSPHEVFKERIKTLTFPLKNITEISQGLIPYDKYRGHDERTIKNRIWHAQYKKDKTYKKELRGGGCKTLYSSMER